MLNSRESTVLPSIKKVSCSFIPFKAPFTLRLTLGRRWPPLAERTAPTTAIRKPLSWRPSTVRTLEVRSRPPKGRSTARVDVLCPLLPEKGGNRPPKPTLEPSERTRTRKIRIRSSHIRNVVCAIAFEEAFFGATFDTFVKLVKIG